MNCIKGAVDSSSRWNFSPKDYRSVDTSASSGDVRRDVGFKFPKTSPLASAVETIPVADEESHLTTLSAESELPDHRKGSSSSSRSHSSARLDSLLSEMDLPIAKRNLRKRLTQTITDAEPSGSGHQTQDAVLKDLLTSTSIIQRTSQAKALNGVGLRSTALRRRSPRIMAASTID